MAVLDDARAEAACQEYILNGGDQSKAYRKGFPKSLKWKAETVHVEASKFFSDPKVRTRVAELQDAAAQVAQSKFGVDAEYVLRRLVEIDQMDFSDILTAEGWIKPPHEWPKVWRQYLSGFDVSEVYGKEDESDSQRSLVGLLKKIKWPDKVRNLELLGKHKAIKAFIEQKEITGSVDHNHTHIGLSETDRFIASALGEGKDRAPKKSVPH